MIGRMLAGATVVAAIATAFVLATASAQTTWVVKAHDPPNAPSNVWDPGLPDVIEAQEGDTVSWEFDQAGTIHNLLLALPDGEELLLSGSVCSPPLGICLPPPNHPDPIQYTLDQQGTYTYFCSIHGGDADGNGMAGRITVGEPDPGDDPTPMPNPSESPETLESCPAPGKSPGKGGAPPGAECAACATGGCSGAGGDDDYGQGDDPAARDEDPLREAAAGHH